MNHRLHESVETHRWPHSRTLRLNSSEIQKVRTWMQDQSCTAYHISVRRRVNTWATGKYSVIIHCRDLDVWPQFVLTWL